MSSYDESDYALSTIKRVKTMKTAYQIWKEVQRDGFMPENMLHSTQKTFEEAEDYINNGFLINDGIYFIRKIYIKN